MFPVREFYNHGLYSSSSLSLILKAVSSRTTYPHVCSHLECMVWELYFCCLWRFHALLSNIKLLFLHSLDKSQPQFKAFSISCLAFLVLVIQLKKQHSKILLRICIITSMQTNNRQKIIGHS